MQLNGEGEGREKGGKGEGEWKVGKGGEGRKGEREGGESRRGGLHSIKASPCPSVSLSYNHILVLHAGCTIVVTRKVITQFKSSVCTEGKRGRKLGWE